MRYHRAILRILFVTIILLFNSCKEEPPTKSEEQTNNEYPNTPAPPDHSTNIPISLVLSWSFNNAQSFDIYFDTLTPPQSILASNSSQNRYNINGLLYSMKYYWKIVAKLQNGTKREGPIWNFTTESRPIQPLIYRLRKHLIEIKSPSYVNIMFQVTDDINLGVDNLTTPSFVVLEDHESVSPTESEMQINKKDVIPYKLKTVLMLDNSASVSQNLQQIKNAAISLVNNIVSKQEIAVYKFSQTSVLLQDFTNDINLLKSAINSLDIGYQTTDLYGAIIEGASRWNDIYSLDQVQQGFLVVLTDGSDTQGSHTINQALSARGNKKVYTVGLGNEIEPDKLQQLGNAGFFQVTDMAQLLPKFVQIQNEMSMYSNSFYWLFYKSPKRGNFNHTLNLSIKNNSNSSNDSYIIGSFNSSSFYSSMVKVLRPNGNETFVVGTSEQIRWESFATKSLKIEYSSNNGSDWTQITTTPDSIKPYLWTVPNTPSSNCKIKITNIDDPTAQDISDQTFSINPPSLQLIQPNGGETYNSGTDQNISWSANFESDLFISFSSNGGQMWTDLFTTPTTNRMKSWRTPNIVSENCFIKITSQFPTNLEDRSSAQFLIAKRVSLDDFENRQLSQDWQYNNMSLSYVSGYMSNYALAISGSGYSPYSLTKSFDSTFYSDTVVVHFAFKISSSYFANDYFEIKADSNVNLLKLFFYKDTLYSFTSSDIRYPLFGYTVGTWYDLKLLLRFDHSKFIVFRDKVMIVDDNDLFITQPIKKLSWRAGSNYGSLSLDKVLIYY